MDSVIVAGEQDGAGTGPPDDGTAVLLPQRRAPDAAAPRPHGHPALPAGPQGGG